MSAPAVAVHGDGGKLAMAWMDERLGKGERRVYWSIGSVASPGKEVPVDPHAARAQDHPTLSFDAAGTVWIAWEEGRRSEQRIRVRSSRDGSGPAPASEESMGRAAYPSLAAGSGVVLVHEVGDKGGESVAFRRLDG